MREGKEEERIRPTVTQKVEEENPGTEAKPDSTLLLAQDNFKEAKTDTVKSPTVKETPVAEPKSEKKKEGKKKDKEPVKEAPAQKAKPAVVTNEGSRTPVLSVPEKERRKKGSDRGCFCQVGS